MPSQDYAWIYLLYLLLHDEYIYCNYLLLQGLMLQTTYLVILNFFHKCEGDI